MDLATWKQKGKFLSIGSYELFVQDEGQGETLVLLHAFPTASWGWHRVWENLSQKYRLIAPDLLGSGFSDKPLGKQYSILHLADLLEETFKELGLQSFHVLAHAYGVSTAQELLARFHHRPRYPWQIKSFCFINGGIFPEVTQTTGMQKFLLTPLGRFFAQTFPSPYSMFKKNFSQTFGPDTKPNEKELQDFWELLTYKEGHKRVPDVIEYLRERKKHRDRWVQAMLETEVPLGLINGTHDALAGDAINQRWAELLPNSPLILIEQAVGHYPPWELPEEVLEAYQTFSASL